MIMSILQLWRNKPGQNRAGTRTQLQDRRDLDPSAGGSDPDPCHSRTTYVRTFRSAANWSDVYLMVSQPFAENSLVWSP
jgi:hypothetical protein